MSHLNGDTDQSSYPAVAGQAGMRPGSNGRDQVVFRVGNIDCWMRWLHWSQWEEKNRRKSDEMRYIFRNIAFAPRVITKAFFLWDCMLDWRGRTPSCAVELSNISISCLFSRTKSTNYYSFLTGIKALLPKRQLVIISRLKLISFKLQCDWKYQDRVRRRRSWNSRTNKTRSSELSVDGRASVNIPSIPQSLTRSWLPVKSLS